jgi:hypothetical protein
MKSALRIMTSLSLLLTFWNAQAQKIYMCKDADGRTLTSDRPIPECANRAIKELGRDGMVRREIPPPLTPEQQREQKMQEAKAKAEAALVEEQRQYDRQILARYSQEKDIEASRKRSLDLVQEQIKRETKELADAEKNLQAVQAEIDAQKKKTSALPADLKHRFEDAELLVENGKKAVEEHEAEIVKINVKYDQVLKRYREITSKAADK